MTHQGQGESKLSGVILRVMGGVYLLGVALFALMTVVSQTPVLENDADGKSRLMVTEPELERDLEQIRESGVLRIVSHNNSSSYLMLRGEEYGFEYELARAFAKKLQVKLEVVLADSQYSMLSMLNQGKGDVVAAPLIPSAELAEAGSFSGSYNELQQVLVVPKDYVHLYRKHEDLRERMVAVPRWSHHQDVLVDLRKAGINVGMVLLSPDTSTEEILDMVADGTYGAAVASSQVAQAALTHRPELAIAFPMSEPKRVSWATRRNSPELLVALNGFLDEHFSEKTNGEVARSRFYNLLLNKYFKDEKQIRRRIENPFHVAKTGRLSPYDDVIQDVAARNAFDWHLIASVCFQESRFDPQAVSWAGAVGLMQVLPRTASMSVDSLKIPEVNLEFGAAYLREMYESFRYLPHEDRLAFALASYNAGKGHVDDARMLAITMGKNPNQWHGSVDECLLLLRRPEYHRKSRYGYVRGTETVAYVKDVQRRYDLYRDLTERESIMRTRPRTQETAFSPSR